MEQEEFEKKFKENFPNLYKYGGWALFPDTWDIKELKPLMEA